MKFTQMLPIYFNNRLNTFCDGDNPYRKSRKTITHSFITHCCYNLLTDKAQHNTATIIWSLFHEAVSLFCRSSSLYVLLRFLIPATSAHREALFGQAVTSNQNIFPPCVRYKADVFLEIRAAINCLHLKVFRSDLEHIQQCI